MKAISFNARVLIVFLVCTNSLCQSQTYNIWPLTNCFSQSCLTLEQFATNTLKKASAKWIKLTLAPGNHSLSSELLLENLENLSLNANFDRQETRIICYRSSRLSLFNISESLIDGITFSECKNNTAMDLKDLTINNCTFFLGSSGSFSLFKLNRTNVLFKMSLILVINKGNRSDLVKPTLFSQASNITIEASNLTIQGAIILSEAENIVRIKNTLISNSTTHTARFDSPPSLIQIPNGQLLIVDSKIIENKGGKIIYVRHCTVNITNTILNDNFGAECILCIVKSTVFLNNLQVSGNNGNFSIIYLLQTTTNITGRIIFSSNVGALLIINSNIQFFSFTTFEKCSQSWLAPKNDGQQAQGTLTIIQSTITFWGNASFIDNNSKQSGGAIYSYDCKITIYSHLLVVNNTAGESGGGAFFYLSDFICHGNCTFTGNKANEVGGGIHAVSSPVILSNGTQKAYYAPIASLSFKGNEAKSGGALYFE